MLQRKSKSQTAISDSKSTVSSVAQKSATSNVDLLSLLPNDVWSGPLFDYNSLKTNETLAKSSIMSPFFASKYEQVHAAFKQLCELICSGARTKAAELLSNKSYLTLEQGKLTDVMGHRVRRIFKNISPLQYCYWAGDIHGLRTILLALKTDAEKAEAYRQMDEVDTHGVDYEQYPLTTDEQIKIIRGEKRFNFQPLIEAYNNYIASDTEENWKKLAHEQFQLPAHVLQEYSRKDRAFYPLTLNHFKEANLPECFTVYDYDQNQYVSFFDTRAVRSYFVAAICRAGGDGVAGRCGAGWVAGSLGGRDLAAILRLIEVRMPALLDIKKELQPKLTLRASNK